LTACPCIAACSRWLGLNGNDDCAEGAPPPQPADISVAKTSALVYLVMLASFVPEARFES
jgi:hypothetical protein